MDTADVSLIPLAYRWNYVNFCTANIVQLTTTIKNIVGHFNLIL